MKTVNDLAQQLNLTNEGIRVRMRALGIKPKIVGKTFLLSDAQADRIVNKARKKRAA